MTQSSREQATTPSTGNMPATDDPAVLRELLRQAREQIRLHRSFDQIIADATARSEALLAEASKARDDTATATSNELHAKVSGLRASLTDTQAQLDRLEKLLTPNVDTGATAATPPASKPAGSEPGEARMVEVVMHGVHTPALARSAQQFLAATDGVTHAEVRELAEGVLRITVESTRPIMPDMLAAWEPGRQRDVRTATEAALEIGLGD